MDEIARYNKARWEELAQARVMFSRPFLDLDEAAARKLVDPRGLLGDPAGKDVLCLAGGGGQQAPALALLGARVTTLDICETQLARDREAAAHYGVEIETLQGDMRDLSRFGAGAFDVVCHAHSINFIPDAKTVFREAARVLRSRGVYHTHCANPAYHGLCEEDWNGEGYPIRRPFVDGAEVVYDDPHWDVDDGEGHCTRVVGPHEFRHALSTLVNGLIEAGFSIRGMWEDPLHDASAEPGSWDHFCALAPPYLEIWTRREA